MASKDDYKDDGEVDIEKFRSKTEKPWLRSERFVCCPWKKFDRPNLYQLGKWKFTEKNNSDIPDETVSIFVSLILTLNFNMIFWRENLVISRLGYVGGRVGINNFFCTGF